MRILLDECVPIQVPNALPGHDVATAQRMGWCGLSNGALLDAAEQAGFDLFIVADKDLRHQQNLTGRRLAILELWTNQVPLWSDTSTVSAPLLKPFSPANTTRWKAPDSQ